MIYFQIIMVSFFNLLKIPKKLEKSNQNPYAFHLNLMKKSQKYFYT